MLHSFPFLESSILISCACSGAHLYFSSSIHNSNRNSKDQLSCYSATIRRLPVVLLRSGWGQRSAAAVNLSPVKRGEDSERRRCSKKKWVMTCCAALWATGGCLWLTFKKRESAEPQSVTLSGVSVCWVAKMSVFSLLVCDCATLCENVCVCSCLVVQPADVV